MLFSVREEGLIGKKPNIFNIPGIFVRMLFTAHMETNQNVESHWSNPQPCTCRHCVGAKTIIEIGFHNRGRLREPKHQP